LAGLRKLAPYSGPIVKISTFWKYKLAAAAILKIKNRDISATVLPIFTKFGTVVQNGSLNRQKFKMADSCHYENR